MLISHGDLQHSGLYAYAYTHWGLRAPTYTTLPVQAMARVAALEEVEDIRAQEEVDYKEEKAFSEEGENMQVDSKISRKFIPSIESVREAFNAMNTLRYSQPTHLQGKSFI